MLARPVFVVAAFLLPPVALTQVPAASSTQPTQRDYRFEVASIRADEATGFPNMQALRAANSFTPSLFRREQANLGALISEAFGVKHGYEMEVPHWIETEHFAIRATPPEGATKDDVPIMLQHLLEDRFALKYHRESRHISGYELVVVKPSRGLEKSTSHAPDTSTLKGGAFTFDSAGVPQFAKERSVHMCYGSAGCIWHDHDHTMQALAEDISAHADAPVKDATGLEGGYDYTLSYQEVYVSPGVYAPYPGDAMEHPMLRDALRQQLGLELRPVKDVTVDVLVIDSASKSPSEN